MIQERPISFTSSMELILAERTRQDAKWGEQNHAPLYWLGILVEEVGELAKCIIEGRQEREELVQVAAVAVAWLEAIVKKESES